MIKIRRILILSLLVGTWLVTSLVYAQADGCISCHKGGEPIRGENSGMMAMIKATDTKSSLNRDRHA